MANIVISFSHVLSNKGYPQGTFPVFYDLFINKLKKLGNRVYYIDNNPMSLNIDSPKNEELFIDNIKKVNPDLIILFNNRFPDLDLSKHLDCPVVIYGVDTVLLYSNIDTLKKNKTYKYIVSSSDDIKSLHDILNVSRDRILKIPFFTGIEAEKKEPENNIVFIGSQWNYTSLIQNFTKLAPDDSDKYYFYEMIKDVEKNPFIRNEDLKAKYLSKSEKLSKVINVNDILWYISSVNRIKVLSSIADLGLTIYGPESWRNISYYPEIALSYSPKLIHSVKHNQDCYNSAKIGISTSHAQAIAAFPWRVTDIMASNACLVTDYHLDFEKYFPGLDVPIYKTPKQAYDICKYLLENEKEREEIVKACNKVINENFRFENYLSDIESFTGVVLTNNQKGKAEFMPILNSVVYKSKNSKANMQDENNKETRSITKSNSFLQNIFSIRNNDSRKVITILGLKIKLKKRKQVSLKWLFSSENKDIHKVITILGIKIKTKSRKLIEQKKAQELENMFNSICSKLNYQHKIINELIENFKNYQNTFVKNLGKQNSVLFEKFDNNYTQIKDLIENINQENQYYIENQIKTIENEIVSIDKQLVSTKNEIINLKQIDCDTKHSANETYWANVYHDTILTSNWLNNKSVSPGRWAVSYIVLYVIYRILDEIKPISILECGLGQSSKLMVQYADINKVNLTICENNPEWADFFSKQFPSAKNYIKFLETEMREVISPYISNTYVNFDSVIQNQKFDFVFIDGPFGSKNYSRPELLEVVDNLADSFVVMLDDMNRNGEQETWSEFKKLLKQRNIQFVEKIYTSDKSMALLCSPNLSYLTSL